VKETIQTEQSYLKSIGQDWSCFDDAYRFIEDHNQEYIDSNIQYGTLTGLKINTMIYVNKTGSIVYAKSVDLGSTEKEVPVPKDLLKLVESGTLITKSDNDSINGIILLDKDPMFISCNPIRTTNYQAPSRGTLIFGRYLDHTLLDSFTKTTLIPLSMYRVDRNMPSDFQTKLKAFSKSQDSSIVETLNEENIAGYFEVRDIIGQPALIMRADFPRSLYSNSKDILNQTYFLLLLTGFITSCGIKFTLDRLFISRVVEIDNFITKVKLENDLSKRLTLKDNDELYRLSREINEMLNNIYLANQEINEQAIEKKVLLDSLNEMVLFVNPSLDIMWANKAALECMKKDLKEAVGISLKSSSDVSCPLSEYKKLEQISITGNTKSWTFVTREGTVWFIQAIPVTNEDGKIIGILETCRDVTEKDKAEQLQKKEIHHRIKNNLQIISALLDLQAEKFTDKKVAEAFKESENRIFSISLIHQELYESGKLNSLDFSSYLHKLIEDLKKAYGIENGKIQISLNVSSVFLWVDTAVSLGIIVNELFTNSVKYAFPEGTGGEIRISLTRENIGAKYREHENSSEAASINILRNSTSNQLCKLIFADNGIGVPEEINFGNIDSLGLQLVNSLVDQIDGSIEIKRDHGTEFIILFNAPGHKT
jgi:two-component sensor histidine kinase/sensor domain CHASE-containing protein